MIKTLLFDFGDVFINLDKLKPYEEFKKLGFGEPSEVMLKHNKHFEVGAISTEEFVQFYIDKSSKDISAKNIKKAWNAILLDFPIHRLTFIKELASVRNFKLILLSNTNALHINWIKKHIPFYLDFKLCFEQFYLSQEIHLRKPDASIYNYVLKENELLAEETLFIDDTKENTEAAKAMGFHVWNINPKNQDVVDLFNVNQHLF